MASFEDLMMDQTALCPTDAAAAILVGPDTKYLLQLRDSKSGIFFPDCWGCFGGGVEATDANPADALRRELKEELALELAPGSLRYVTRLTFDLRFCGLRVFYREYYKTELSSRNLELLRLGEGREMRSFSALEVLTQVRMAPYDSFVLWMHINRERLLA